MFNLTNKEREEYNTFRVMHYKTCNQPVIPVMFTPGGIGISVTIYCPTCEKTKDITDVDSW